MYILYNRKKGNASYSNGGGMNYLTHYFKELNLSRNMWIESTIIHPNRIEMGLTNNEYALLDYVYKTQVHPDYGGKCGGWCLTALSKIGDWFFMSKSSLSTLFKKMEKLGFMEIKPSGRGRKTTEKWYRHAYKLVKKERSESERTAKSSNLNRSESERLRSESERKDPKIVRNPNAIYKESIKSKKKVKLEVKEGENKFSPIPSSNLVIEENNTAKLAEEKNEPKKVPQKKGGDLATAKVEPFPKRAARIFEKQWRVVTGDEEGDFWGDLDKSQKGKEFGQMKKLLSTIKRGIGKKNGGKEVSEEEVLENFYLFLEWTIDLNDNFYLDNFTPGRLNSQYSNIITKIKRKRNGKSTSKKNGHQFNQRKTAIGEAMFGSGI